MKALSECDPTRLQLAQVEAEGPVRGVELGEVDRRDSLSHRRGCHFPAVCSTVYRYYLRRKRGAQANHSGAGGAVASGSIQQNHRTRLAHSRFASAGGSTKPAISLRDIATTCVGFGRIIVS